jgi:hypothetical protein
MGGKHKSTGVAGTTAHGWRAHSAAQASSASVHRRQARMRAEANTMSAMPPKMCTTAISKMNRCTCAGLFFCFFFFFCPLSFAQK